MRNDQVFTPLHIVTKMLDEIGFVNEGIVGKTIFEPSFGDGAFLVEIAKRILDYYTSNNIDGIQEALSRIYGVEIDKNYYDITIHRLNCLLESYNLVPMKWTNLKCENVLEYNSKKKFDYIVGNPPYIRIHDLDDKTRNLLKEFKLCNGTTDFYITFFELCINKMKAKGKLCFITPNSYLKNSSQKRFRDYLIENKLVKSICNYGSVRLFNASTYTAITLLDKSNNKNVITYTLMKSIQNEQYITYINLEDYINKRTWCFNSKEANEFLKDNENKPFKLEDICNIQYGVATNADKIYIISEDVAQGLDAELLRTVIKASTLSKDNKIIFPYKWNNETNSYSVILEDEMKTKYNKTYRYLLSYKNQLLQRDMENGYKVWYQYARSQGIQSSNNKKFVIKHCLKDNSIRCEVAECGESTIVYSGIYLVVKNEKDKDYVESILKSNDFCRYLLLVGKDISGGYKTVNTTVIKKYGIDRTIASLSKNYDKIHLSKLSNEKKEKVILHRINITLLDKIKKSYSAYLINPRGTTKIKPIHSYIAEVLQYKLGQDYNIIANDYYGNTSVYKEQTVKGQYYNKKVDICVLKNGIALGSIAVKFICSNFGQNCNNYLENMLGETFNLRANGNIYAQLLILPEYLPYFKKDNTIEKIEYVTKEQLLKYKKLIEDITSIARPDVFGLILINLDAENNLTKLINMGEKVNRNFITSFINLENIKYSDFSQFYTENEKSLYLFLKQHSDFSIFIDTCTNLIKGSDFLVDVV